MKVVFLPGDGVGRDVTAQARKLLEKLAQQFEFPLEVKEFECGGKYYLDCGKEWPDEAFSVCRDWADAIFLGAVGWPKAKLPSGDPAGKNVLFGLRLGLDLYANIRPAKLLPGVGHRVHSRRLQIWEPGEVDLVIFRENTEGLYADTHGLLSRGGLGEVAVDSRVITRRGSERIIRAAFQEAEARYQERVTHAQEGAAHSQEGAAHSQEGAAQSSVKKAHVTCVDKSNVLDGCRLFRSIFREIAKEFPDVETDERYIDAFCQALLWEPKSFDVAVMPNLFGDIASDVAAVLGGGLGMAPSYQRSDTHALFEPVHGSAPPLAGTGRANPLAAILSLELMLQWLGRGQLEGAENARRAAKSLSRAILQLLEEAVTLPEELGGKAACEQVGDEIARLCH